MSKKEIIRMDDDSVGLTTDIDAIRMEEARNAPPKVQKKKRADLAKRVPSGFLVLSIYILSYHLGVFYQELFALYMVYSISEEVNSVGRDQTKDKQTGTQFYENGFWWSTILTTVVANGILNYRSMTLLGFTKDKNPIIFGIIYEYNLHILMVCTGLTFIAWIYSLKKQKFLKYQLGIMGQQFLVLFLCVVAGNALSLLCRFGRFWYLFPQGCIAYNDTFAYLFGRFFGKHKLIQVSPNKTVEGFLGGAVGNLFAAFFMSGYQLTTKSAGFWKCESSLYSFPLFENYECQTYNQVFHETTYSLPFSSIGISHIDCLPA